MIGVLAFLALVRHETIDFNGDGLTTGVETLAVIVIAVAAVLGALAAIFTLIRKWAGGLRRTAKRVEQFLDQWGGDEDAGLAPMPDRMAVVEDGLSTLVARHEKRDQQIVVLLDGQRKIAEHVAKIDKKVGYELTNNGGGSVKDASDEALRVVKEVQREQEQNAILVAKLAARYADDQRQSQHRWSMLLRRVSSMMGLTPEEQREAWAEVVEELDGIEEDDIFPFDSPDV